MSFICTSFSAQEDWTFGQRNLVQSFSLQEGTIVAVGFTGNAWIAPFSGRWNISTTFSLAVRNDTGRINSTPRAITVPVLRLLEGCNHTLTLAVSDPDGDDVRCRWAVGAECASICGFPGAILDSNTCVIEYEANRGIRYWAAAVMIEDFLPGSSAPLSSVALQFLVLVIPNNVGSCSQIPEFVQPTILAGSCVAIPPGATFTTQLVANSRSSSGSIVEIQTVPPLGTMVGQLTRISTSNLYYVNVTWTPTDSQQNETHPFCFTAVESDTQTSEQACIDLLAGYFPPTPLPATASPRNQLVHPANNTKWSISFDTNIERSSVMGNIVFSEYASGEKVYRIDASQSQEVTFEDLNSLSFTPSFSFAEKTRYYITFARHVVQGLDHCRPGNEPVLDKNYWTFETMDITPPTITFLVNPVVSNGNISLTWESNENVTWACTLELGSVVSVINCSNASWRGYGLSEGLYVLHVTATDEAGNMASSPHTFQIDQTPPIAIIQQRPNQVSNERMPTLAFSCNDLLACSYVCRLISNTTQGNLSPCNSGTFTTPALRANTNYTFLMQATDQVGNEGATVSYTWETDFEAPRVFEIQNTSALCNNTHPDVTGQPQAIDNRPEVVTLEYSDMLTGCSISRTWRGRDRAGNVATIVQYIDLELISQISLLPRLSLPCDSSVPSVEVSTSTASAPNPCNLPLQLTHEDSEQPTCPGTFTRNWTLSSCGRIVNSSQLIILYDLCPPYACGRNETTPRGTCSLGECNCNRPWHGENCDTIIYDPVAEPVNNSILFEGEDYMVTVAVSQGSPPLTWTLTSGPRQLQINQVTGQVTWRMVQAGTYLIVIQIENQVGQTQIQWNLQVMPRYSAILSSVSSAIFPYAQSIQLSGYVEYAENEVHRGVVLVLVDIVSNGATRTVRGYTTSTSGNFSLDFYPSSTEYGAYTAAARHPSLEETNQQSRVQWRILGMRSAPQRVTLNGEALSTLDMIFHNATFIINNGPGPLTGISATPVLPSSEDVRVEITLRGSPSNTTLQPGEQLAMDIRVVVSRPLTGTFLITVDSAEGTRIDIFSSLRIDPILPSLMINPSSLNARIVRGRSRAFEFNVTNVGRATAHNVQAAIPSGIFLSFLSFGNIEQGSGALSLEAGRSALLSILARTSEEEQLGVISANILVSSTEVFASLPVTLTVSSDSLMNLTVIVEDEYTYFATGRPLVDDATVTIINNQRNLRLLQSTSARNGSVVFSNIYEDRYEMIVEADSHRRLSRVIITSIESPAVTVFLERQTVTYTWSVTPVTYQDRYMITLEADFETSVPIPVITVTPNEINLNDLEAGLITSFQINVTNHGLIRADNVRIELPSHPSLQFSTNVESLGHLEPLSSILVSVNSTRHRQRRNVRISTILYLIHFAYEYVCGELQTRRIPVIMRQTTTTYDPVSLSTELATGSFTGLSGSGPGSGSGNFRSFTSVTPFFCDPCVSAILGCLAPSQIDLFRIPLGGCIALYRSDTSPVFHAIKWTECDGGSSIKRFAQCAYEEGVFSICLRSFTSRRRKRNVRRTLEGLVEALYPIQQSIALGVEILGDDVWISVGDPQWLSNVLQPALDDASEAGVLISATELSTILAASPPNGTTTDTVSRMVNRVNNTLSGWTSDQLEPREGSNMASYSRVQEFAQNIDTFNAMAVDRGFSSYLDAYNFASGEVNQIDDLEEEAGICAVVRIRIEQELAITREAFLARLEIENMENMPLQEISVEIIVTDLVTGEGATHLFAIDNGTLSGSLEASPSGSTWSLSSGATGAVEWLIIPYSEAAPDTDHVYNIGGSFSYLVESENITVPFAPTPITVTPDPSLLVHYFWERYVVGDNPFTEEVEPSVPFTLGVAVKNAGSGTAFSLQISSGQPEIIENERGLLIDFMIIGSNIGSESASPSLSLTFGDLLPSTTVVARWYMISSLQGEFMGYSATFENINPLGDPRLSVLDDLQIHELIKNVDMYTLNEEDGIMDFLVNDLDDFLAYPDGLYSSRTLERYNVSVGAILSVNSVMDDMTRSLVVTTSTNSTGWVYFRYEDTQDNLQDIALSINGSKIEGNQNITIPSPNSWITTDRDGTFYLHILDYFNTTDEEVVYTLNLCTDNCTSFIEVPSISNPPTINCKILYL